MAIQQETDGLLPPKEKRSHHKIRNLTLVGTALAGVGAGVAIAPRLGENESSSDKPTNPNTRTQSGPMPSIQGYNERVATSASATPDAQGAQTPRQEATTITSRNTSEKAPEPGYKRFRTDTYQVDYPEDWLTTNKWLRGIDFFYSNKRGPGDNVLSSVGIFSQTLTPDLTKFTKEEYVGYLTELLAQGMYIIPDSYHAQKLDSKIAGLDGYSVSCIAQFPSGDQLNVRSTALFGVEKVYVIGLTSAPSETPKDIKIYEKMRSSFTPLASPR